MKGSDPPHDYLQKPSRRRILSLSAGALATGLSGCSSTGLSGTSELSSSDQTALEEYADSYENAQRAKDRYEDGIEIFRENVGANGTIEGDYPAEWPELQEQMMTAEEEFSDASGGFSQAGRSASSTIIESGCEIAIEWVEPHIEVAEFFRDLGGPSKEFVNNIESKISRRPKPLAPETLRERAVNGESLNLTPAETPTNTPTPTPDSSTKHEFKSPPYDTIQTEEGPSSTTVSGRIVLEEGQYAQYNFELEETTQIHITGSNEGEGTMDLFLLKSERELNTYMEGESADFSGGFIETNIETVDRSLEASSGGYFLVFDNSAVYGAEPKGEVVFEFEMVLGDPTPSQPKIREVQDNFGNTFTFSRDASDSVRVDDEIVVSDDTVVELCVTEVAKQEEDDLVYSYWFGNTLSEHPDNVEKVEDNCNSWDMQRSDYQSDWGFKIWISNEDEIGYQNEGTDYRAGVNYTNLKLEE